VILEAAPESPLLKKDFVLSVTGDWTISEITNNNSS
jgi:hypothetical protein